MQFNLENLSTLERKLKVEVPLDRVNNKVKSKLQKIAVTAKMPGFRPGKVPFNMIEKQYAGGVRSEILEETIRDTYMEALTKENLKPAGMPKVEVISSDPEKDFIYEATFEVYPEVKLVDFKTLDIEKPTSEVIESDVDDMLQKMRKNHADWIEISDESRKSQEGDRVTVDIAVVGVDQPEGSFETKDEKDIKFALGDGSMWKDFDDAVRGMKIAEEKKVILQLPKEHSDKELAGKEAEFTIKLNEIYEAKLPDLDEEFAKKLNIKEGLEGLKSEVRKHMERELESMLQNLLKKSVMDKMLESHTLEVPKVMLENELSRLKQQWQDRFTQSNESSRKIPEFPREDFVEQAKRSVILGLLLSSIVQEHDISVDQSEVQEKVRSLFGDYYDNAEPMMQKYLSNEQYMKGVEALLLEEKTLDYLASLANLVEKPLSYKDVMAKK